MYLSKDLWWGEEINLFLSLWLTYWGLTFTLFWDQCAVHIALQLGPFRAELTIFRR